MFFGNDTCCRNGRPIRVSHLYLSCLFLTSFGIVAVDCLCPKVVVLCVSFVECSCKKRSELRMMILRPTMNVWRHGLLCVYSLESLGWVAHNDVRWMRRRMRSRTLGVMLRAVCFEEAGMIGTVGEPMLKNSSLQYLISATQQLTSVFVRSIVFCRVLPFGQHLTTEVLKSFPTGRVGRNAEGTRPLYCSVLRWLVQILVLRRPAMKERVKGFFVRNLSTYQGRAS